MNNYKYLVCVQADSKETGQEQNNNKFYEMKENDDGTFTATYGRIGAAKPAVKTYPINKWNDVVKQKTGKIRNGYIYKDITHLKTVPKNTGGGFLDIKDSKLQSLLNQLQSFSKKSLIDNYTVSAEAVAPAQIDEAQNVLNCISNILLKRKDNRTYKEVNDKLINLFQVVPRKMKKVSDYLIGDNYSKDDIKRLISSEQDTLDVMAGQVNLSGQIKTGKQMTLEDALGIKLSLIEDSDKQEILKLLGSNASQFKNAYIVDNVKTSPAFEKYKKEKAVKHWTKLLWHGSRNENWLNILKTGLLIRPSGAVLTGAMFGNGIYFADKAQKSIGYSSLRGSYWSGGSANVGYLALYAVNTGMELRQQKHESWMYNLDENNLKSKGNYDSLFAEGGVDLRNNEYIVYNPAQCTIKYLIEIN